MYKKTEKNKTYAFFDLDETVISFKSMFDFIEFHFNENNDKKGKIEFEKSMQIIKKNNVTREVKNKVFYSNFRGKSQLKIKNECEKWFFHRKENKNFFNSIIVDEIKNHQKNGTECIFVSGSFEELVRPIAKYLKINTSLCIKLEENDGIYTGKIKYPQTIGKGKAIAIRNFLNKKIHNKSKCFSYGDDISDIHMLEEVGNPCIIRGNSELERYAKEKNWKILSPTLTER